MKRFSPTSFIGFILSLSTAFASAQTVILTADDFAQPGDFAEFKVCGTPSNLTADTLPGIPGVVDTLKLNTQTVTDQFTLNFVLPSAFPEGALFPSATVAYTSPGNVNFFLQNTSSNLKILGTSGDLQGTQLVAQFTPPYTLMNYPCTLGTLINTSYSFENWLAVDFLNTYDVLGTLVTVDIDSAHVKRQATVKAHFNEIVQVLTPDHPSGTLTLKAYVRQDNIDTLEVKLGAPISIPALGVNYPADWVLVDENLYTLMVAVLGYDPGVKTGFNTQRSVEYFAKFRRFRFAGVELNPDNTVKRVEWISNVNNISNAEEDQSFLKIFPNPVTDNLRFVGQDESEYTVRIFSVEGRLWVTRHFSGTFELSLHHLPAGMFLAEITEKGSPYRPMRQVILKQ
ncbi:MAG: T9SS type A sorting domain-containing protein [Flavobacteriales bacterium]|nr:T9SS type A sorting domain-containing protein [Flavobacteriales bacterium]MCX7768378.1 T9SS type A sorting domain-containing protein [Flavobacteriales bacterium]MDW8409062.1 T9SS type A sorting domain-containing protein [Flavobacteriales bacterium]